MLLTPAVAAAARASVLASGATQLVARAVTAAPAAACQQLAQHHHYYYHQLQQQQQQAPCSSSAQPPAWPHQRHPLQQTLRWPQLLARPFSAAAGGGEAAKRRLASAHQRRQREAELLQQRAAARAQSSNSLEPQAHAQQPSSSGETALVAPQETPPSETQVAAVVHHPALVVTRSIEWGTLILGFEQATKYTVYDEDGNPVALIAEEISGLGNEIQRQLLRTRRSFTSTVLTADGSQVVFRVRRPAYLVNSYMYIEDPQGAVIGEVRQRWHLWRRKYDLFLGRRQFAAIDGGFLAWEFRLTDGGGNTLALIDRNFLGFAKEIFTDAGRYCIHFGSTPADAAAMVERTLAIRSGQPDVHVTPLAQLRTKVAVIPSVTGNQLVVQHPLPLDERMIALAAAISVDYNFFSQHSSTGGFISPPLFMPMPLPGGAGEAAAGAEGAAGGEAAAGGAPSDAAAGPSGAAAAANEPSGGFGAPEAGSDAGFSSGWSSDAPGSGSSGFSEEGEGFRWDDLAGGGGDGGGSSEEGPSGLWGLLVGLWAMLTD